MQREIVIKKSFYQKEHTPLVTGDLNAYKIFWDIGSDAGGATLQIVAKRSNGTEVYDFSEVSETGTVEYVLKNNMYEINGGLKLFLSVVKDGSVLTEKIVEFYVIPGSEINENGVQGENTVIPISQILSNLETVEDDFNAHKTNTSNPHNVTKEQIGLGYVENALRSIMRNKVIEEETLSVTDANDYLPIESVGILGNAYQGAEPSISQCQSVTCVENPTITINSKTVQLNGIKLYGIKNNLGEFIARDKVYCKNGKCYFRKEVNILNKKTDFIPYSVTKDTQTNTNLFSISLSVKSLSGKFGFCNYLPYRYVYTTENTSGIMAGNSIYIRLDATEFPTIAKFNSKINELAGTDNPFTVYYALKTPIETEIPLNGLEEFEGDSANGNYSVSSDLPAGIEVEYNQNLTGVIDELKNVIITLGGEL